MSELTKSQRNHLSCCDLLGKKISRKAIREKTNFDLDKLHQEILSYDRRDLIWSLRSELYDLLDEVEDEKKWRGRDAKGMEEVIRVLKDKVSKAKKVSFFSGVLTRSKAKKLDALEKEIRRLLRDGLYYRAYRGLLQDLEKDIEDIDKKYYFFFKLDIFFIFFLSSLFAFCYFYPIW